MRVSSVASDSRTPTVRGVGAQDVQEILDVHELVASAHAGRRRPVHVVRHALLTPEPRRLGVQAAIAVHFGMVGDQVRWRGARGQRIVSSTRAGPGLGPAVAG